jgi:hypothetical protein
MEKHADLVVEVQRSLIEVERSDSFNAALYELFAMAAPSEWMGVYANARPMPWGLQRRGC